MHIIILGGDLLDIERTGSQGFSNHTHFKNFVNYLMRTDSEQKWTNEYTELNAMVLKDDGIFKAQIATNELLKRKQMGGEINKIVDEKGFSKNLQREIFYFNLEGINNILEFVESFVNQIESTIKKQESLCYVLHVDQEEFHIHRVFFKV